MSNRVFIVGMMGSGKSYTGKRLAEGLGFAFQDLDDLIEDSFADSEKMGRHTEGSKIAKIFETHGEPYFRQLESDCLKSLDNRQNIVVATGGGAACYFDNIDWMNKHGAVIYLKTNPELLFTRLKNQTTERPLLRGRSDEDLLNFIKSKLAERSFFYEQAAIIIEQKENGNQIATEIAAALKADRKLVTI